MKIGWSVCGKREAWVWRWVLYTSKNTSFQALALLLDIGKGGLGYAGCGKTSVYLDVGYNIKECALLVVARLQLLDLPIIQFFVHLNPLSSDPVV